jgi:hypothetical protein
LKYLKEMRLKEKDSDEADGFFYADGPNLVEIFCLTPHARRNV